jgi:2-keto-4-pentenoate hydratase
LNTLSKLLAAALDNKTVLDSNEWADLVPQESDAAYQIQHDVLALRGGSIGGWKIGAPTATAPGMGSLLPQAGVHGSGARLVRADFQPSALELEIAFRFNRSFVPRDEPYADAEVMEAIGQMGATIEVVSSRYASWPDLPALAVRADFQCHGALIVGEFIPYQADFPYLAPSASFKLNDIDLIAEMVGGKPANSVGDPRRLLPWLVEHCRVRGITVTPEMVVTGGSYTGCYAASANGEVRGEIAGLPPVSMTFI